MRAAAGPPAADETLSCLESDFIHICVCLFYRGRNCTCEAKFNTEIT